MPEIKKVFGRGSRVRTRDLRFWRPSLYQLSYTPRVALGIGEKPAAGKGYSAQCS